MIPRNFTSESGRAAQVVRMAGKRRDEDETFQRANPPDLYTCPHCGETLSGPPRLYTCPDAHFGVGQAVLRQPRERAENERVRRLVEVVA